METKFLSIFSAIITLVTMSGSIPIALIDIIIKVTASIISGVITSIALHYLNKKIKNENQRKF